MPEPRKGFATLVEAFTIMLKYDPNSSHVICGDHEIVYAGRNIDIDEVSPKDIARLDELGWVFDDEKECFCIHT